MNIYLYILYFRQELKLLEFQLDDQNRNINKEIIFTKLNEYDGIAC